MSKNRRDIRMHKIYCLVKYHLKDESTVLAGYMKSRNNMIRTAIIHGFGGDLPIYIFKPDLPLEYQKRVMSTIENIEWAVITSMVRIKGEFERAYKALPKSYKKDSIIY